MDYLCKIQILYYLDLLLVNDQLNIKKLMIIIQYQFIKNIKIFFYLNIILLINIQYLYNPYLKKLHHLNILINYKVNEYELKFKINFLKIELLN